MTTRTIITPVRDSTDLATEDGITYWKQVLPEDNIVYKAKGVTRKIDFDHEFLTDLTNAFHDGALDQVPFMLADTDNRHTMDPERYRADVVDLRMARPGENPGLYAKIKFANREAAAAVLANPKLGVSARIREGVERARDGRFFKRAIVHILGTLDPRVTGMASWQPAVDLSSYDSGDVLDLSRESYSEEDVAKNRTQNRSDVLDLATLTEEDIPNLTDEQLEELLERLNDEDDTDELDDDEPDDDEDEDETDEPDDDEDDAPAGRTAKRVPVSLSNPSGGNDIELANARADEANARANEALRRMAEVEWKATRERYLRAGVPANLLDLAEPVLNRPDEMVIDLSNGADDEDDVNVSQLVRGFLDAAKGTIDLGMELGHDGALAGNDLAEEDRVLAEFEKQFPL